MAYLFAIPPDKMELRILDPGADSGILPYVLIERLQTLPTVKRIEVTGYENDRNIVELLKSNLAYMKANSTIKASWEDIKHFLFFF